MMLRRDGALLLVAALACGGCSAERTKTEATGVGMALGFIAIAPLSVLAIPYAIADEQRLRAERDALHARLDPVYLDHVKRIRERSGRADAEQAFADSGPVFLAYGTSWKPGPATPRVVGVAEPDEFVCSRLSLASPEGSQPGDLQRLIAPDPLHDPGPDYWSDVWTAFNRAREQYVIAFNRRMEELSGHRDLRPIVPPSSPEDGACESD